MSYIHIRISLPKIYRNNSIIPNPLFSQEKHKKLLNTTLLNILRLFWRNTHTKFISYTNSLQLGSLILLITPDPSDLYISSDIYLLVNILNYLFYFKKASSHYVQGSFLFPTDADPPETLALLSCSNKIKMWIRNLD